MNFGIDDSVKSSNRVPFTITKEKYIQQAYLDSVTVVDTEVKKGENQGIVKTLDLKFVAIDGPAEHTEKFWPVDPTGAKAADQLNYFNQKIKHIIECYIPWPSTGVGVGATDWADYFTKIATFFNTASKTTDGTTPSPIFLKPDGTKIPVYLYLTYKANNGNVQIPLPNFIEKAVKVSGGTGYLPPKTLTKGRNDLLEQPTKSTGAPNSTITGGVNKDDLPPGFG